MPDAAAPEWADVWRLYDATADRADDVEFLESTSWGVIIRRVRELLGGDASGHRLEVQRQTTDGDWVNIGHPFGGWG